jgi:hypothetical protein
LENGCAAEEIVLGVLEVFEFSNLMPSRAPGVLIAPLSETPGEIDKRPWREELLRFIECSHNYSGQESNFHLYILYFYK